MAAEMLKVSPESIAKAADLLSAGEIVAMPTETVYGLAGPVFDEKALAKIFAAKERPTFDPLIAHVADPDLEASGLVDLSSLSGDARAKLGALTKKFWPGPLTIVLPKTSRVPDLATSGLQTVAVRMPRHPAALDLIRATGSPLAAPSANRFGRISPTTAEHVIQELADRIPLILDGGACEIGLESTIIALASDGKATLLRPGGTSREEIEAVLGTKLEAAPAAAVSSAHAAPGMLASHYAPRSPLVVLPCRFEDLGTPARKSALERALFEGVVRNQKTSPINLGFLFIRGETSWNRQMAEQVTASVFERSGLNVKVFDTSSLSHKGDLAEAARNLFAELRRLDASGAQILFSEPCFDPRGLGFAISDRLKRASA